MPHVRQVAEPLRPPGQRSRRRRRRGRPWPAPTAGFTGGGQPYEPEALEPEPFEPDVLEPEAYEPEPVEREPYELEEDSADETPRRSGRQLLRVVVPLAIVAWIVISNLLNR